ncbi:hypothetical protein BO86DRAFT_222892 [Aspergillus japonicus CBS 114.51]|uniref:3'-5' exonuclease domain-containing protein n=1 Tax=Aspergillus japonicus CBS 114.51 TaxID=1448312 RepID=A0A8T8WNC5_ASPJA|nr:hypothetical protein BO86DRAFT_222892 [Aspergillus japonicus CBS 114.51]RAH77348.1 hypothetical protein BO86DRAFT_222892 [Aspergillus japonicus CBS 114.51]
MADVDTTTIHLIDTEDRVSSLVDVINAHRFEPLYIDLKGVNLYRGGTLSLMLIYLECTNDIYAVDLQTLGARAFSTTASSRFYDTTSLQTILESPETPKVFFGVWDGSDALFNQFQILIQGVDDLQLMQHAASGGWLRGNGRVTNLAACIRDDAGLTEPEARRWRADKERGRSGYFYIGRDGDDHILRRRPLDDDFLNYCAADVAYFPRLRRRYSRPLDVFWRWMVERAAQARVAESQEPRFRTRGGWRGRILGPWDGHRVQGLRTKFVEETGEDYEFEKGWAVKCKNWRQ